MSHNFKQLANIEEDFFDLDKEKRVANMRLRFATPAEIFDANCITKTPMLSDEFSEWLNTAFEYAPKGYKIDIDVGFDSLDGYSEEGLKEIFIKNIGLDFKKSEREKNGKNKMALLLLGTGIIFLVIMLIISNVMEDGLWKEIVYAITEIASWVTIWEALAVFIIENREHRIHLKRLKKNFQSIRFYQIEPKAE